MNLKEEAMKKKYLLILILLFIPLVVLLLRFVLGGAEDDWICQKGEWVKHGNPSFPKPQEECLK